VGNADSGIAQKLIGTYLDAKHASSRSYSASRSTAQELMEACLDAAKGLAQRGKSAVPPPAAWGKEARWIQGGLRQIGHRVVWRQDDSWARHPEAILSRAQRMPAPVLLAIDSLAATPRIRRAWIITRRKCTL